MYIPKSIDFTSSVHVNAAEVTCCYISLYYYVMFLAILFISELLIMFEINDITHAVSYSNVSVTPLYLDTRSI